MWQYNYVYTDELSHHGILGQRWGIRRFQNKDGSLTPEGRKRLGLNEYEKDHQEDIILKKGTKATRVVNTPRYSEYKDESVGGSVEKGKQYLDKLIEQEKAYNRKYVSVDGVRNSGRYRGDEFYLSWFTDDGYEPDSAAIVDTYRIQRAVKIASGKKVIDEVLNQMGTATVSQLLKDKKTIQDISMAYTLDKDLFDRVNEQFKNKGYDAVEDINDRRTDMPLIFLNSKETLGNVASTTTGERAIDELIKKYYKK